MVMAELSRRGLFQAFRSQPETGTEGATSPVTLLARIGDACVEPKGVTCRRCGDECDAGAITFRLVGRGRAQVMLDAGQCTGCGACVSICPTQAISLISTDRAALIAGLVELRPTP